MAEAIRVQLVDGVIGIVAASHLLVFAHAADHRIRDATWNRPARSRLTGHQDPGTTMISRSTVVMIASVLFAAAGDHAIAQDAASRTDAQSIPNPGLTPAQKQTLYTSVVNLNMKNESLPDFQPIVGSTVPEAIKLERVPKTIVELVPKTAEFEIARVANQVIVVDPKSRKVVDVISGEKP